jgi:hypothetical protein
MKRNQPVPSAGLQAFIAQPPDFRCRSAAKLLIVIRKDECASRVAITRGK